MLADGQDVGLLGVTRAAWMPSRECYLEYLWVAPGSGGAVSPRCCSGRSWTVFGIPACTPSGCTILDGNDPAMRLYQRFGFQSTNERQPLPDDPARNEERMRLGLLADHGAGIELFSLWRAQPAGTSAESVRRSLRLARS